MLPEGIDCFLVGESIPESKVAQEVRIDRWLLVDNGSIRAEAVRFLRRVAADLSNRVGFEVAPASYNHSHRIPATELDGKPAELMAEAARKAYREGARAIGIVPFFLSGGGGILKMVEREATLLAAELPGMRFWRTDFLIDGWGTTDRRLASAVVDRIREGIEDLNAAAVDVVLVDHGSPYPEAAGLRNFLGGQVSVELAREKRLRRFAVGSMERRAGAFYAFNEPLLETVLKAWGGERPVVIGQLFLGPGKHAGAEGDIASIAGAILGDEGWLQTQPLGDHPKVGEMLAERVGGGLKRFGLVACRLDERERCPCCRRRG